MCQLGISTLLDSSSTQKHLGHYKSLHTSLKGKLYPDSFNSLIHSKSLACSFLGLQTLLSSSSQLGKSDKMIWLFSLCMADKTQHHMGL